ncbi:MAG: transketolase [Butyrivibrio sp.]|uniref:transketolase n=1 Tax=Butyrivibrio sp. TaxID=28121 RepID=UPI001B160B54|nr:transketolase [Butyrivibrio sp.]MBO6240999.1 transketolase [Butyrivibrio sp.]
MNRERVKELSIKAMDLRKVVLEMIRKSGGGHIGGDFSVMETLVTLYFDIMNISPDNKDDPDRDYFVMSKGHSVESYYAVLADKGFFDTQELIDTFSQFGSKFIGHPNNEVDGVEMNSGSLGHGLPVAVGMALACRMDKRPSRIYTVMGDGELAEGSVWEGFMAAGHYKLGNLCAVVDRNHLQISGTTEEVMTHENLHQQVESFGWNVLEANGNSISEMSEAFQSAMNVDDKPTLIIANTIKGFGGGDVMENNVGWHHHVPNDEEYEKIVKAIDERREELENE